MEKVREWGLKGLTVEQMCHNIGICHRTLYNWCEKYPEFKEALQESRFTADEAVENALYRSAINGNVTAQIFWLKNRRRKDWGEKKDDGQDNVKINITL